MSMSEVACTDVRTPMHVSGSFDVAVGVSAVDQALSQIAAPAMSSSFTWRASRNATRLMVLLITRAWVGCTGRTLGG